MTVSIFWGNVQFTLTVSIFRENAPCDNAMLPHSGSILDSQLGCESGKFQLVRWSHRVALLSWNHPPTRSPSFSNRSNDYWELVLMCGVPPPLLAPCSENMCGVPPSRYTLFLCGVPPSNLVLCLEHFGSVLDSEQNWESDKFQLARWNQAQLVSSIVALLAELVLIFCWQSL